MAIPIYTDINTNAPISAGRLGNYNFNVKIESEICGSGAIKFGYAAQVKSGTVQALATGDVTSISANNTMGVAMFSHDARGLDSKQYEQYDQVGLLKTGTVWVVVHETVAKNDPVRVTHTTDGGNVVGMFGTTANALNTALVNGARFMSASETDADGVKVAQVFLPDSITLTADT